MRILVIKLSALGDFVLSIGSFQAIRRHHGGARITLLTTGPYVGLAEASGCFDEVWTDRRPSWWKPAEWMALARRLRGAGFDRVYDLQRSQRTACYFRLAGRPQWVGAVKGCSHRYQPPPGRLGHVTVREAEQLALAGIAPADPPDISFLTANIGRYGIEGRYALLVPGSSAGRATKRWSIKNYTEVAKWLAARGIAPVLICGPAEREEARVIAAACQQAYDIDTNLAEIAELARGAALAVANDTGPMHLIAAAGCPCLVLFSAESNPAEVAPRGRLVCVLKEGSLKNLSLERVLAGLDYLQTLLRRHPPAATAGSPPPQPRRIPKGRP